MEYKPSTQVEQITIDKKSEMCLAQNLYWEARGTSIQEMVRIANVVRNRVISGVFPDTVCEVVYQPRQFSWTNKKSNNIKKIDKLIHNPVERQWWIAAQQISYKALTDNIPRIQGIRAYHANYIKKPRSSYWNKKQIAMVSDYHTFYR